MSRIITLLFLVFSSVLAFASGGGEKADYTIGVATITLQHQFFIEIDNGIKDYANAHNIKVIVNDPNQDTARQNAAVEDFVQQNVDGMIIISIDGTTIIPALEEAAKKVPIVTIDEVVKSDAVSSHIGTINRDAGVKLGEFAKKYIAENLNGKAKIGIVTALDAPILQERIDGFKEALGDAGITYLNPLPGYDREESLNTVESMLQANPDLDIIYATAENAVLGAKAAVESANNTRVKIVGFDLTPESAEGIKQGTIVGMIQQQPYEMGKIATETLLKAIKGEKVEKSLPTPVLVYTKDNIDSYK